MEYTEIQASQIMPVSALNVPAISVEQAKRAVEAFFFSQGPLAYKVYKNAYTQCLRYGSLETFVEDFFDVLEVSLKMQLKESVTEGSVATKEAFDILRNTFKLLGKSNVKFDPKVFFGTLLAFVLTRIK